MCLGSYQLSSRCSSIQYVGKIFRKTNISYPLIRTRMCAYQGVRNVSFPENFAYVLNGWPLIELFCRELSRFLAHKCPLRFYCACSCFYVEYKLIVNRRKTSEQNDCRLTRISEILLFGDLHNIVEWFLFKLFVWNYVYKLLKAL